ncbi:CBS domain-containing protein [Actinomadura sp. HBU206391]|nr:CBS domain-containing protein [Actinomadura sp. HBU206391]
MRRKTVQDVMTRAVVAAYQHTSFKNIAQIMIQRGITALPVICDGRKVIGVVSEADLLTKEQHKDDEKRPWLESRHDRLSRAKARAVTAEELMTTPAITIRPDTTIAQAARLLDRHRIKRLPVVDDQNVLLGIVSRRDLLRVFARPDEEIREEIIQEVLTRLLMADPEAVSINVSNGIVTLGGTLEQRSLIPIVTRLIAATEGVVDVIDELGYVDDDTTEAAHRVPRA